MLEGPAPEDLDAREPHVSRGTAGAMRRPSARRSKRPEPADQGVQKDTATLCQRRPLATMVDGERISSATPRQIMEPHGAHRGAISVLVSSMRATGALRRARQPQSGHSQPTGDFTWNREHALGTWSAPASTAGARRSGPSRPSVRRVGARRRRVRLWVSASPRLRAAAGRRRAGGFAGDRGAQRLNVTDDCCWSSALDPQAYRAARVRGRAISLHGSVGETRDASRRTAGDA